MFADSNILKMPIILWCGLATHWLIAIGLGNHSITYSLPSGIEKQVGFIWAIGWNIGDSIFLPIFLVLTSQLVSSWREVDREALSGSRPANCLSAWKSKVDGFAISFWAIMLSCLFGVFVIQWVGVYFIPMKAESADVIMIDWWLVALVDPSSLSIENAMWSSFFGFAYSGLIYWFLFAGMLLQYIVSSDFADICTSSSEDQRANGEATFSSTGTKIVESVYRCTIVGIILALTIKLNGAYLVTDGGSITAWLLQDMAVLAGFSSENWSWIENSPPPFFTSFVLLFLHIVVFAICSFLVGTGLAKSQSGLDGRQLFGKMVLKMSTVLVILSIGYLAVGLFTGFSVLLAVCVLIATASLFQRFPRSQPIRL